MGGKNIAQNSAMLMQCANKLMNMRNIAKRGKRKKRDVTNTVVSTISEDEVCDNNWTY